MISTRTTLAVLVLLTLAALGLRLNGLGAALPMEVEPDCKIPYQVEVLRSGDEAARSEPDFLWYPLLIARLASLGPGPEAAPPSAGLDEHLAAAAALNLHTRLVVALLSVLIVPATFLLARLFFGRGWSLFAAALTAVSLLDLSFSQQARPHAPAAALFLLAVLAAVRVRRRGNLADHALLGLAGFGALACLQSGLAVLPALLAAYALREGGPRRLLDPRLLVSLLATLSALPLMLPPNEVDALDGVVHISGHQVFLEQFNGRGFGILFDTLRSYEPLLLGLLGLGLVFALSAGRGSRRALGTEEAEGADGTGDWRDLLVVLCFAMPYLLATGLYERNYERFVLPLLPYFACVATYGVVACLGTLAPRRGATLSLAVAVALLAFPTYAAARLSALRAGPTTIQRTADWVREHVSADERVLLFPEIDLPLWRLDEGLRFWGERTVGRRFGFLPWARYQAELGGHTVLSGEPSFDLVWPDLGRFVNDPVGYLELEGCDLLVLEVFAEDRTSALATRAREQVRAACELLVRISPDGRPDWSDHPFAFQNETSVRNPNFTARVLQADGTGPVIEVYRAPTRAQ